LFCSSTFVTMILFPPAKVNLGLNVLHKRSDGYHAIETGMLEVPFFDVLELLPAEKTDFKQSGLEISGNVEDNLCMKAYRLMETSYQLPSVYMHLRKQIPFGAGLGGGSADATYVLKGLNELFSLQLDDEQLRLLASQLGSDCSFFVAGGAAIARGRGEEISPIDLSLQGTWIKLVNPGIHVSTAEAYSGVRFSSSPTNLESILLCDKEEWRERLKNDFEPSIFERYPAIGIIKDQLYEEGAFYAAMSGSGSTLFGLYEKEPKKSFNSYFEFIGSFG
jgi:4-diphosphocytidyl-2-C-methyl-D-erythritol kinase